MASIPKIARTRSTLQTYALTEAETAPAAVLRVAVQVSGHARALVVPLQPRMLIGRCTGGDEDAQPTIDLNVYGARERGVSRLHALLAYHDEALFIEDLDSRNGTRINGYALETGRAFRLRPNDELELGTLRLYVRLMRAPDTAV